MKNIFKAKKRLVAGAAAAAMLISGAVFAEEEKSIMINDVKLDGAQMFTTDENVTYIPVRRICETLGMTVEWDGENDMVTLVNLPVYITFSPHADGYTFAKTAPMKLGSAPILEDGTTYVPLNFIDEILHAEYTTAENGDINIKYEIDKSVVADVLEKNSENGRRFLRVMDYKRNDEVILNFTDETAAVDAEGKAIGFEDIADDARLRVVYADAMTMSLPPITNAVSIEVIAE